MNNHKNLMENLAVLSMKNMDKENSLKCSRAVLKAMNEKGFIPEDLLREIIDLGIKLDKEKLKVIEV